MKIRKLIVRATLCKHPHGVYAYAAPAFKQAKQIAWPYLCQYHDKLWRYYGQEDGLNHRNISGLWVDIPNLHGNMSRITLYGLDTPKQNMRGLYLDGIVLD